jgi:hypothetical protein
MFGGIKSRVTTQRIRAVQAPWPVLPSEIILLEELGPPGLARTEGCLGLEVCQWAVISDHAEGGTLQETAPYPKGVYYCQELALSRRVVDLRFAEFARLKSDGLTILK